MTELAISEILASAAVMTVAKSGVEDLRFTVMLLIKTSITRTTSPIIDGVRRGWLDDHDHDHRRGAVDGVLLGAAKIMEAGWKPHSARVARQRSAGAPRIARPTRRYLNRTITEPHLRTPFTQEIAGSNPAGGTRQNAHRAAV
jgi:hypothetical protein